MPIKLSHKKEVYFLPQNPTNYNQFMSLIYNTFFKNSPVNFSLSYKDIDGD